MMTEVTEADIRHTMIWAGRVLVLEGQDDFTRGHISFRHPAQSDRFFMKSHGVGLDEITEDNILTLSLDGEVLAGSGRRHSEFHIHSEILRVRPDVNCVLHTHPPHAVALSNIGGVFEPYSQSAALFVGGVGEYVSSVNLIRTREMGIDVAEALGGHRAVLLRSHGAVTVGRSIAETVIGMIMLENAARIQLMVQGKDVRSAAFSAADLAKLTHDLSRPEQFELNFDYLVRRAKRRYV
jgi:ribulose-5-phosphate 4-epimerase/fuculose-1-phosphate aldolase